MADQVDEIKQKIDIVGIISEYVDLKRAGRNYKALCPFHSEKSPSFMVSSELQIYKCFGCGESGDVYSFLQKYEGMEFYEALQHLANRTGIKLDPGTFKDSEGKKTLFEINKLAQRFYQYVLLTHPAGKVALNYLVKNRGIKTSIIKEFNLGYSPDSPNAITKFIVEKKGFRKNDVVKAGILYQKGNYSLDRFRGRIIFPLYDHRGNIVGFSGRILPELERALSRKGGIAKYINTPETPIYHKANVLYALDISKPHIKKKGFAIVVEGELDAISSWQAGFKNIVAIKGSSFTVEQARLLSRFCRRVVLALDADVAGDAAARRGINIAEDAGLEVSIVHLEGYKDPDELVQKNPEKFAASLKNAKGVWDFIVASIFSKYDASSSVGKAKISRELVPILATIGDEIVKAHFTQFVAKGLSVPTEAVADEIDKTKQKREGAKNKIEELIPQKVKPRKVLLEERLLTIAFSMNPKILLNKKITKFIETPLTKRILQKYQEYSSKRSKFDPSTFAETLPKELVEGFAELILNDTYKAEDSQAKVQKEFEVILRELEVLDIKNKLDELEESMKDYDSVKMKKKLKGAEARFSKLTQRLTKLEEKDFGGIIL
ncbi:DNA primase [Candidatus Woesebacteria bacterium RBG_16_39_8b]|uniref:DNA primase n=1 Tax=Candidatus Woesebacteria bacterium RBG_16_39_8b TaxID=1802482 RepID=A0A1F7X9F2_9BACT|nr:MAG: DNA primase [Candidatus Woesebacteria bacterium RBG_16_39_8b]